MIVKFIRYTGILCVSIVFLFIADQSHAANICWDGGGIRLQDGVRLR